MLSSITDLLVHITSPSDAQFRDARGRDIAYNLRQKLDTLFGSDLAPRLAYHKLLEVRGDTDSARYLQLHPGLSPEELEAVMKNKELGDYKTRLTLSRQKIDDFARIFINDCFAAYCDGDRAKA